MTSFFADVQNGATQFFVYAASFCATIEPNQSVWIMASFGSFFSALYGPPRKFALALLYWIGGILFAISWERGVDHFEPNSEAFLVGLASGAATKAFIDRFSAMIGATMLLGGKNNAR